MGKNEENTSGSKQDLDAQLEYDYDNDRFIVQEHVQDDYDDEDQAGNYMDDDEYNDIETTTTGHSFVNQRHDTESSDDPPHDPEFLDRDYGNNHEVDKYIEEEPMITEQQHTYSDIHIRTNQKLSLLPEFMKRDYDNVFKSQNVRDTRDYALPITTGIFAFLAVIAILITGIRCRSNNKSRSSAQPTTWDTQKAKELVPVIRGFHPKTAGG